MAGDVLTAHLRGCHLDRPRGRRVADPVPTGALIVSDSAESLRRIRLPALLDRLGVGRLGRARGSR